MLKRKITKKFKGWKAFANQKALLVVGARQVGKSFAIREFGKANYERFIEINLFEDKRSCEALKNAADADDFISRVTMLSSQSIIPGNTLVFIDEVQEAPDVVTMAKFLVEDGRCHWAFSGSMLGTEFKGVRSYPVGSVHELLMNPLDIEEFYWAIGVSDEALEAVRYCCKNEMPVEDYIHEALMANFRTYLVSGGMPEAVQRLIDSDGDLAAVRQVLEDLNRQYRRDISKYAGKRALQVQSIFDQLPIQLEGDTRRFMLNSIDPQARYEKYQRDFVWLTNAGVALKTDLVSEPKSPLLKTASPMKFKLYQSDTGMLMARYPLSLAQAAYLDEKDPNLGSVYENVVAQQLTAQGRKLYYYQTRKRGEVDFVVEADNGKAVPIEVKSGRYFHSHAALDHVMDAEGYNVDLGIVLSRGNIERRGKVLYLPLYATPFLSLYLDDPAPKGFKLQIQKV